MELEIDLLAKKISEEMEESSAKVFKKANVVVFDDRDIIILKTSINTYMEVLPGLNANEFDSELEIEQFIIDKGLSFEIFGSV